MTQYQVTASCVTHIPIMAPGGMALGMYYQGAILPDGVPDDRIKHLLNAGMIAAVGEAEPEPEGGQEPGGGGGGGAPQAPALSVNSRSSKADLVAHGIAQGGTPADLEQLTRDQLLERYVRKPE